MTKRWLAVAVTLCLVTGPFLASRAAAAELDRAAVCLDQKDPAVPKIDLSVPTIPGFDILLKAMADMMEDSFKKRPTLDDNESRREFYGGIINLWLTDVLFNAIALPVATAALGGALGLVGGVVIGGAIGAVVGFFAGGVTVAAGALVGASLGAQIGLTGGVLGGAGLGLLADIPGMTAGLLIAIAAYIWVDQHYPSKAETSLDPDVSRRWACATQGLPGITKPNLPSPLGSQGGPILSASIDRSAYAGPNESAGIYLMSELLTDQVQQFADRWDRYPGLTPAQQQELKSILPLRPLLQRLAYVKKERRLSPRSLPALPVPAVTRPVTLTLIPDIPALLSVWFGALGLTGMKVSVSGGQLAVKPPASLVGVGAPSMVSAGVPAVEVSGSAGITVNGVGVTASLSASVKPGGFDLALGGPAVVTSGTDRGEIAVPYSVPAGATLGSATMQASAQLGKLEKTDSKSFSPTLASTVQGALYFRAGPGGVVLEHVTVNNFSVSANIPALSLFGVGVPIPQSMSDAISKGVQSFVKDKAAGGALDLVAAFRPWSQLGTPSLARALGPLAPQYHVSQIRGSQGLHVIDYKGQPTLAVTATVTVLDVPMPPIPAAEIAYSFSSHRNALERMGTTAIRANSGETGINRTIAPATGHP